VANDLWAPVIVVFERKRNGYGDDGRERKKEEWEGFEGVRGRFRRKK
jgi:hypothetical protein